MRHRVAVLVSGGGTNLQALIDASQRGDMPHVELALVVSSREGVMALERAQKANIATNTLAVRGFADKEEYDAALAGLLIEQDIDAVALAGFLPILGPKVIGDFPARILNVHPSLIPSFCGQGMYGLHVHKAVLARGVKLTGATVHLVNEITDGGEILMQKAVEVLPDDTPEILQQRVMQEAEWQLLPQALELVCARIEEETNAKSL